MNKNSNIHFGWINNSKRTRKKKGVGIQFVKHPSWRTYHSGFKVQVGTPLILITLPWDSYHISSPYILAPTYSTNAKKISKSLMCAKLCISPWWYTNEHPDSLQITSRWRQLSLDSMWSSWEHGIILNKYTVKIVKIQVSKPVSRVLDFHSSSKQLYTKSYCHMHQQMCPSSKCSALTLGHQWKVILKSSKCPCQGRNFTLLSQPYYMGEGTKSPRWTFLLRKLIIPFFIEMLLQYIKQCFTSVKLLLLIEFIFSFTEIAECKLQQEWRLGKHASQS
jgi:hypothetical protein